MMRKRYTDFTQLLPQDVTISGLCPRSYALTNLVMRYSGFGVPLMLASDLLKLIKMFYLISVNLYNVINEKLRVT